MKKNFVLLIALIAIFYKANIANAGTLLEPYAGVLLSSSGTFNDTDMDISGTSVGAKLGFQQLGFSAGLDGRRTSAKFDFKSATDTEFSITQLGFFVGYDFPAMIRVWGTYVFSVEGTDVDDSASKISDGTGTTFGVGYAVLPFVSLNLEMSNLKTSKYKTTLGEQSIDGDYTVYTLGVSIPLSL